MKKQLQSSFNPQPLQKKKRKKKGKDSAHLTYSLTDGVCVSAHV